MSALLSSVRWAWVALLWLGCGDAASTQPALTAPDAAQAPRRVKPRTVSIELFRTTERALEQAADGSLRYGPLTDLDGVEVCAAKQRPAFASFQAFTELDPPRCATSTAGQSVFLSDLPANADLVITLSKDGYRPGTMTFRTDNDDVAAPPWGSVSNELLREDAAAPWLESEPPTSAGDGMLAVWAAAVWAGASFELGKPQLSACVAAAVADPTKHASRASCERLWPRAPRAAARDLDRRRPANG